MQNVYGPSCVAVGIRPAGDSTSHKALRFLECRGATSGLEGCWAWEVSMRGLSGHQDGVLWAGDISCQSLLMGLENLPNPCLYICTIDIQQSGTGATGTPKTSKNVYEWEKSYGLLERLDLEAAGSNSCLPGESRWVSPVIQGALTLALPSVCSCSLLSLGIQPPSWSCIISS